MSARLTLCSLTKRYDDCSDQAVADFSLEVGAGEFVTLLGPSGSGKTTILKMIAGFERPSSGEILIGSTVVTDLPPYRRGVGMVFQNYALFPHLTVVENIAFPLSVRDRPRAEIASKVEAALRLVRLESMADRYPRQLSGGQQQRVALARGVVFDPPLLLMDEPLGALDRNLRESMKFEIKQVQNKLQMTVIYVTHDQDEALAMSDRICVLRHGRLMQAGTARELYHAPVDSFVANFVGEANLIAGKLIELGGVAKFEIGEGVSVPVRPPTQRLPPPSLLMIRPQQIKLAPPGSNGGRAMFGGKVIEAVFLGETTRYRVAAGPITLTVKEQNGGGCAFPIDSEVAIGWDPEAATLLRD
jgi:putative spermidine/putrescine transport system ATP-binding protein